MENDQRPPREWLSREWLLQAPVHAISLTLFLICVALLAQYQIYPKTRPLIEALRLFSISAAVLLGINIVWQLLKHRPPSPFAYIKTHYFSMEWGMRILAGLPFLAVCIVLLPFFSTMKAAIPIFNDYSWDETFIRWDQTLFFGYDAWQVLQPFLGFPYVTAFLALLYHLWMLLLFPGCTYFAFARVDRALRRRFFLSYVLSWTLIGSAMATWLASVGPCFVGPILGDPHFDAQMAYLNQADKVVRVMTLDVQELLIGWHMNPSGQLGAGITAMPSMHCAIAFLYWLAMREISPKAGLFFGAFALITWISSVHLAYHYAVDGLVSLIAVSAIWWASKRIIVGWEHYCERFFQPTLRTNTVPAE